MWTRKISVIPRDVRNMGEPDPLFDRFQEKQLTQDWLVVSIVENWDCILFYELFRLDFLCSYLSKV